MLQEQELDGHPLYLEKQQAVLIGKVADDADSRLAGRIAYYHHSRGALLLGEYEHGEFIPQNMVEAESRIMSKTVQAFNQLDVPVELSSIGGALLDAAKLASSGGLSEEQAHVYALREIHDFSRGETATILNIEPTTSDTQRYRARDNVEEAQKLIETRDDIIESRG